MDTKIQEGGDISAAGVEVPLQEVARQLKRLWQSQEAATRASIMNFAIYSERPDSLAENTEVIREVTQEHACRALLIAAEPGGDAPEIRSWITAHCHTGPGGGKSICSEQISFHIKGGGKNVLPNTLFGHLDSDLPLTFWWQGEFSENWEPHLYTGIDRLVVDSSQWKNPLREFSILEQAWRNPASTFSVNDLTWTRVLYLRMALAAAFDEPGALAHLAQVNEVEVDYCLGHSLAARMFAAWVAHQAGWTLESGRPDEDAFIFRAPGNRSVRVYFQQEDSRRPVPHVELRSPLGVVKLVHEENTEYIHALVGLPEGSSERLFPCPVNTPAELVTERLRRGCNTKLYFQLLQTVRAFLGQYA